MNLPAPFRIEDDQIVADLPHARALFSTARGGVSEGAFDSLNLGLLTDDAPENVAENRRRLGKPSAIRGRASVTDARSTGRASAAPPSRRRRSAPTPRKTARPRR